MMSYMERIAIKGNDKRRHVLIDILRELNCPYQIHCEKVKDSWIENIIISFNPGLPKVVLAAHYDAVDNSTGANDNGSGVCILLKMIEEYLKTPPIISLEIVFFDGEEMGRVGSNAYINKVPSENISAMINLDICGTGHTIVVAPRKNLENSLLGQAFNKVEKLGGHKVEVIDKLPSGDDCSFESKNIPNISVCVLEHSDIPIIAGILENKGEKIAKYPAVIETMHNGPRDSINVIEEWAMELVLKWTMDVVANFECA